MAMWRRLPAVSTAFVEPPGTATVQSFVSVGSQVVA